MSFCILYFAQIKKKKQGNEKKAKRHFIFSPDKYESMSKNSNRHSVFLKRN